METGVECPGGKPDQIVPAVVLNTRMFVAPSGWQI
jgi:hypothetical protein